MGTFTEYAAVSGSESITSDGTNLWAWVAANPYKISKFTPSGGRTDYTGASLNGDSFGACLGPDGRLWFTDYVNNRLVACTTSGTLTVYTTGFSSKGPCGICSDGTDLYVACLSTDQILKVTAATGAVAATINLTAGKGVFQVAYKLVGATGTLFFTCNTTHQIGRCTTAGGSIDYKATKTGTSSPYGICIGPDGLIWYVEALLDKVAKLSDDFTSSTATTHLDYATGASGSTGRYIISDGTSLWTTSYSGKKLVKFDTSGTATTITFDATRTPNDYPLFLAAGSDSRIWVTAPLIAYAYAYADTTVLSASDSFTFSEGSSVDNGTKSASDSVSVSDSAAVGATRAINPWNQPSTSAPAKIGSRVTIRDDTAYNAFPGGCRCPNGDLLAGISAYGGHVSAGGEPIVLCRSTDNGATWTTQTASFKPSNIDPAMAVGAPKFAVLSDESIVMTFLANIAPVGTTRVQVGYCCRSTDNGVTWSNASQVPTLGNYWASTTYNGYSYGNTGGALQAGPAVEVPGSPGHLRIAMHAINSGQDPTYCYSHTAESTDYGATWTTGTVIESYSTSRDAFEPHLLYVRLRDGSYKLTAWLRSNNYGVIRRADSFDNGATWSTPTTVVSGLPNATEPSVFQVPDGGIVLITRETLAATSFGTAYVHTMRFSSDYGATFGSPVTIDGTGGTVYNQWFMVGPTTLGSVYALDMGVPVSPAPNIANTDANVYYQAFTVATPSREYITVSDSSSGIAVTFDSRSASDTVAFTDSAAVTVGVGAITKTASDGFNVTDTSGGLAVTYWLSSGETVVVADGASSLNTTTVGLTASDVFYVSDASGTGVPSINRRPYWWLHRKRVSS